MRSTHTTKKPTNTLGIMARLFTGVMLFIGLALPAQSHGEQSFVDSAKFIYQDGSVNKLSVYTTNKDKTFTSRSYRLALMPSAVVQELVNTYGSSMFLSDSEIDQVKDADFSSAGVTLKDKSGTSAVNYNGYFLDFKYIGALPKPVPIIVYDKVLDGNSGKVTIDINNFDVFATKGLAGAINYNGIHGSFGFIAGGQDYDVVQVSMTAATKKVEKIFFATRHQNKYLGKDKIEGLEHRPVVQNDFELKIKTAKPKTSLLTPATDISLWYDVSIKRTNSGMNVTKLFMGQTSAFQNVSLGINATVIKDKLSLSNFANPSFISMRVKGSYPRAGKTDSVYHYIKYVSIDETAVDFALLPKSRGSFAVDHQKYLEDENLLAGLPVGAKVYYSTGPSSEFRKISEFDATKFPNQEVLMVQLSDDAKTFSNVLRVNVPPPTNSSILQAAPYNDTTYLTTKDKLSSNIGVRFTDAADGTKTYYSGNFSTIPFFKAGTYTFYAYAALNREKQYASFTTKIKDLTFNPKTKKNFTTQNIRQDINFDLGKFNLDKAGLLAAYPNLYIKTTKSFSGIQKPVFKRFVEEVFTKQSSVSAYEHEIYLFDPTEFSGEEIPFPQAPVESKFAKLRAVKRADITAASLDIDYLRHIIKPKTLAGNALYLKDNSSGSYAKLGSEIKFENGKSYTFIEAGKKALIYDATTSPDTIASNPFTFDVTTVPANPSTSKQLFASNQLSIDMKRGLVVVGAGVELANDTSFNEATAFYKSGDKIRYGLKDTLFYRVASSRAFNVLGSKTEKLDYIKRQSNPENFKDSLEIDFATEKAKIKFDLPVEYVYADTNNINRIYTIDVGDEFDAVPGEKLYFRIKGRLHDDTNKLPSFFVKVVLGSRPAKSAVTANKLVTINHELAKAIVKEDKKIAYIERSYPDMSLLKMDTIFESSQAVSFVIDRIYQIYTLPDPDNNQFRSEYYEVIYSPTPLDKDRANVLPVASDAPLTPTNIMGTGNSNIKYSNNSYIYKTSNRFYMSSSRRFGEYTKNQSNLDEEAFVPGNTYYFRVAGQQGVKFPSKPVTMTMLTPVSNTKRFNYKIDYVNSKLIKDDPSYNDKITLEILSTNGNKRTYTHNDLNTGQVVVNSLDKVTYFIKGDDAAKTLQSNPESFTLPERTSVQEIGIDYREVATKLPIPKGIKYRFDTDPFVVSDGSILSLVSHLKTSAKVTLSYFKPAKESVGSTEGYFGSDTLSVELSKRPQSPVFITSFVHRVATYSDDAANAANVLCAHKGIEGTPFPMLQGTVGSHTGHYVPMNDTYDTECWFEPSVKNKIFLSAKTTIPKFTRTKPVITIDYVNETISKNGGFNASDRYKVEGESSFKAFTGGPGAHAIGQDFGKTLYIFTLGDDATSRVTSDTLALQIPARPNTKNTNVYQLNYAKEELKLADRITYEYTFKKAPRLIPNKQFSAYDDFDLTRANSVKSVYELIEEDVNEEAYILFTVKAKADQNFSSLVDTITLKARRKVSDVGLNFTIDKNNPNPIEGVTTKQIIPFDVEYYIEYDDNGTTKYRDTVSGNRTRIVQMHTGVKYRFKKKGSNILDEFPSQEFVLTVAAGVTADDLLISYDLENMSKSGNTNMIQYYLVDNSKIVEADFDPFDYRINLIQSPDTIKPQRVVKLSVAAYDKYVVYRTISTNASDYASNIQYKKIKKRETLSDLIKQEVKQDITLDYENETATLNYNRTAGLKLYEMSTEQSFADASKIVDFDSSPKTIRIKPGNPLYIRKKAVTTGVSKQFATFPLDTVFKSRPVLSGSNNFTVDYEKEVLYSNRSDIKFEMSVNDPDFKNTSILYEKDGGKKDSLLLTDTINYYTNKDKDVVVYLRLIPSNSAQLFGSTPTSISIPKRREEPTITINYLTAKSFQIIGQDVEYSETQDFKKVLNGKGKELDFMPYLSTTKKGKLYIRYKFNGDSRKGQLNVHSQALALELAQQPKILQADAEAVFKISYASNTFTFKEDYNSDVYELSLKDSLFTTTFSNITDVPIESDTAYFVRLKPSNDPGSQRFSSNLIKFKIPKQQPSPGYSLYKISESLKLPVAKRSFPLDTFEIYYGSSRVSSAKAFDNTNYTTNELSLDFFGELNNVNTIFARIKGDDAAKRFPSEFDTIVVGRRFTPPAGEQLLRNGVTGEIIRTIDYDRQLATIYFKGSTPLKGYNMVYATRTRPDDENVIRKEDLVSKTYLSKSYKSYDVAIGPNDKVTFKYISSVDPNLYPSAEIVMDKLPQAKGDMVVNYDPNRMKSLQTFYCVPETDANFRDRTLGSTQIFEVQADGTKKDITRQMMSCDDKTGKINEYLDFSSVIGKQLKLVSHFVGNGSTPEKNHFRSDTVNLTIPSRAAQTDLTISYEFQSEFASIDYTEQEKRSEYKTYMDKLDVHYTTYLENDYGKLTHEEKSWNSLSHQKNSDRKVPIDLSNTLDILTQRASTMTSDIDSFYVEVYRVGDFVRTDDGRDTVFFSSAHTTMKLPLRPSLKRNKFNIRYIEEKLEVKDTRFKANIITSDKTEAYDPVKMFPLDKYLGTTIQIQFLGDNKTKQFGTAPFKLPIPPKLDAQEKFAPMSEYDYAAEKTKRKLESTNQYRYLKSRADESSTDIPWIDGPDAKLDLYPGQFIQFRTVASDADPTENKVGEDERFATNPYTVLIPKRDTLKVLGKGSYNYIDYTSEESSFSISSTIEYWTKSIKVGNTHICTENTPCKFDQTQKIPLTKYIKDEVENEMYLRRVASNSGFKTTIDTFKIPGRIKLQNVGDIDYVQERFNFKQGLDLKGMIVKYSTDPAFELTDKVKYIQLNPDAKDEERKLTFQLTEIQVDNEQAKKGIMGRFRSSDFTMVHDGRKSVSNAQMVEDAHFKSGKFNFLTGEYALVDGYEYSTTTRTLDYFLDSVTIREKDKFVISNEDFYFYYRIAADQAAGTFASKPVKLEFKNKFAINQGKKHLPEKMPIPFDFKKSYFFLKNEDGVPTHDYGFEDYQFALKNEEPFHKNEISLLSGKSPSKAKYFVIQQSNPVYFRARGKQGSTYTNSQFPSEIQNFVVQSGPPAPNFQIDFLNETIGPISSQYEYRRKDQSEYTSGDGGMLILQPKNTYYIRVKATDKQFYGFDQEIVIPDRPDPDFKFTLSVDYESELTVEKIPDTIEYRYGSDLFYTAGKKKTIVATIGTTIYYRLNAQPNKNKFASKPKIFVVAPTSTNSPKKLKFDLKRELVLDVSKELQYMWSSTFVKQDFSNNRNSGFGANTESGEGISIPMQTGFYFVYRNKATAGKTASKTDTIGPFYRKEEPNLGKYTIDIVEGKIFPGFDSSIEYIISSSPNFQDESQIKTGPGATTPLTIAPNMGIYLRTASDGKKMASKPVFIGIPSRIDPPFIDIIYENGHTSDAFSTSSRYSLQPDFKNSEVVNFPNFQFNFEKDTLFEQVNGKVEKFAPPHYGRTVYFQNQGDEFNFSSKIIPLRVPNKPKLTLLENFTKISKKNIRFKVNAYENQGALLPTSIHVRSERYNGVLQSKPEIIKLNDSIYQMTIKEEKNKDRITIQILSNAFQTGNFSSNKIVLDYIPLEDVMVTYPNPATNQIRFGDQKVTAVAIQARVDYKRIEIYDLSGNLIATFDKPGDAIDISGLPHGIYNVLLYTKNDKISSTQFVKVLAN